ncbi:uncharacterized protein RHOBADRAFT_56475 [Rhodotorula graminis WP1]|uniref:Trafficking protein particle complex subunit 11 domain-containing protein n=1 Tax=Rhodotorula graminis (strain WP1) TaxID=578459 RepID=A0A0P9EQ39_RHOGW|nr:uncharacterized protein RHOBADRAFT_56475 [Rhodotorula graminis WP1]KPV71634.1 hypothetical protein RHOBADRAFT_56475 [Rhodotorula graminis WP1]
MANRVGIAYEALPSNADFEAVRGDVERHLPLRNLHWVRKTSANRTIRTIQTLPLDVRPLPSFHAAHDLLDRPYLHLLFVVCDDNEVYRATLRHQIREWLDTITARHHQEWLVVHVTHNGRGAAKFYQRKGTIVDKIKADFNVGKRDRCIQVVQGASADDPTAWAEFLTKVKEGVVATFDTNVGLYEENVRKADSQRQLEGWQFLPFFRQKEALADSFEAMTLYEDALIQYDELEAAFFQNAKEHGNAPWFRNIGGLGPGDDALSILSTGHKPYRKLVESNTITIFDFRVYLFARQAAMLYHLGRVVEVARRGAYFVSTFARKLREHQAALGQNFVESWTYSACLTLVAECEARIEQDLLDTTTSFVAVKAELLELAKKQLDKIGMGAGHLPAVHPFSMSFNESAPSTSSTRPGTPSSATRSLQSPTRTTPPVTRQDLIAAMGDEGTFDRLYTNLASRTAQAYQASGRRRSAAKVSAFLAALEHHRQHLAAAQKHYSALPVHYTDSRWTSIDAFLLSRCTELQHALDMPRDRLLSTLALVRAGVTYGGRTWGLEALVEEGAEVHSQNEECARRLMRDVYDLSATLTKDFAAVAFPTFEITLKEDSGARAPDEDGMTAVVSVRNVLPCEVRVDEVRLKLATAAGEQVWLTSGSCVLRPGSTPVTVFCPTSVSGRLTLELSQLRFSRIIFQYSHRPPSTRNLAPDPRIVPTAPGKQPSLFLAPDHQAVVVSTDEPDSVHLDREREIIVVADPGRNSVTRISLRLVVATPDVHLAAPDAQLVDEGKGAQARLGRSETNDTLVLEGLRPFEPVRVKVPLRGNIVSPIVEFTVIAEYATAKRPSTRRTLRSTFAYSIALPLAVNVQDYFRKHCLLSKFSVTTDGMHALKVRSAHMQAPKKVTVKACRPESDKPVILAPAQTANFLFKMTCDDPSSVKDPLRLVLSYSSTEHRLRTRVRSTALATLSSSTLVPLQRWIVAALLSDAFSSTDVEAYCADESLEHLSFDERTWRRRMELCLVGKEVEDEVLAAVRQVYTALQATASVDPPGLWRTLEIPLELPALNVLNLVRISPAVSRVEVGQAIPATLTIQPTFHWSRAELGEADEREIRLVWSVVANPGEWVVGGQARGEFVAQDGQLLSIPFTLIPLRPSSLFLPSISITPLASPGAAPQLVACETQHLTAAVAVEVLPIAHRSTFEVLVPARA